MFGGLVVGLVVSLGLKEHWSSLMFLQRLLIIGLVALGVLISEILSDYAVMYRDFRWGLAAIGIVPMLAIRWAVSWVIETGDRP